MNNMNKNIIDYKVIVDNIDDYKNGFGDGLGFGDGNGYGNGYGYFLRYSYVNTNGNKKENIIKNNNTYEFT
jgi:hypothetical protein